jgi:small subunit ribosomal protein S17
MMKEKNIGFGISSPKVEAKEKDQKSPFSGALKVRGRRFVGVVIAAKMQRTATVEWDRTVKIPKYERYMRKRSRVKAHNPDEIKAQEGDIVEIIETRPLSKTKHFVIVQKMGKQKGFTQKMAALEESKVPAMKAEDKKETKEEASE